VCEVLSIIMLDSGYIMVRLDETGSTFVYLGIKLSTNPDDQCTYLQPLQDIFGDFSRACFPSEIRTDELALRQPSVNGLVDLVRSTR
jgi:hypothetical protein